MKFQICKYFIFVMMILNYSCIATNSNNNSATIEFEKSIHEFGELVFNENFDCSLKYSNNGSVPLVIQNVVTSCGCTVPAWSKKPLKPGENEVIKISYDTSHPGAFRKTITIYYNGENSPENLIITGTVSYPKDFYINQNEHE